MTTKDIYMGVMYSNYYEWYNTMIFSPEKITSCHDYQQEKLELWKANENLRSSKEEKNKSNYERALKDDIEITYKTKIASNELSVKVN